MDIANLYCRLCAECKPPNKQLDLDSDHEKKAIIIQMLVRINSTTDFETFLPNTVCFDCNNTLHKAFDFVLKIERAQVVLRKLFSLKNVKKEIESETEENQQVSSFDNRNLQLIKVEFEAQHDTDHDANRDYSSETETSQQEDIKKSSQEKYSDKDSISRETVTSNQEVVKRSRQKEEYSDRDSMSSKSETTQNQEDIKDSSPKQTYSDKDSLSSESDTKPQQVKIKKSQSNLPELCQQKLTWSNYNWICRHCDTRFNNIDELRTHSMQCHNICNPYQCADCKTRNIKLDSFLCHVQTHHPHLKSSCYKCFKKLESPFLTRDHIKNMHITNNFCPGCHSSFTDDDKLKQHMDDYNQTTLCKPKPIPQALQTDGLTCKVCQKTYKSRFKLNSHLMIHTERKRENICDICGKGFFEKQYLKAHLLLHTEVKPHKCQICNASFKTAERLKCHIQTHNNVRPYSCSQCNKRFRTEKYLISHKIIHTDDHPYPCQQCSKRFRFKSTLNNHVRTHTGDRPYTCEMCKKAFTNWSNYNKHMKRKHNIDKSKKKHTPDGAYPIDPTTGALIKNQETSQIIEWKKKMKIHKRIKRTTDQQPISED